MFFLFSPKAADCAVSLAHGMIVHAFPGLEPLAIIDNKYSHVDKFYRGKGISDNVAERKIFFGHGLPDGTAVETLDGELLDPAWWTTSQQQFRLSMFHACHGAKFFSNPALAHTYEDWISYKDELLMLFGVRKVTRVWEKVFIEIFKLTKDSANSQELKSGIIEAYEDAIQQLEDLELGGIGDLAITHFEWAIDSICSKSDLHVA